MVGIPGLCLVYRVSFIGIGWLGRWIGGGLVVLGNECMESEGRLVYVGQFWGDFNGS